MTRKQGFAEQPGEQRTKRAWIRGGRSLSSLAGCCLALATVAVPLWGNAPAYAAGPDPQGTIYVADDGTNAVDVFAPGSNGNVAPERVISGPDTGINEPGDVKVSPSGDVYVSNFGGDSITEYAPGASGDASPICTISGPNTGLDENDDMSLEADGTLVVGNFSDSSGGEGSVVVFPAGACGDVTPAETIEGSNTGFAIVDGVGTDAAGTIYADSSENEAIEAFPAGANGNVSPESSITGPDTGLGDVDDIIVGFNGEIYATSGFGGPVNSVTVYAPGASGDATPVQDITGPDTDFGLPDDLAVDDSGNIYVTDSEATVGPAVLEYASGATGDAAPSAYLAGSATTFSEPEGVAVAGPPSTVSATMTTAVAASTIARGQSTSDTATLSGGTVAPTGSIVFKLFGPNDPTCSNAPAFTSTAKTVTGDGNYTSPSFTPTQAGKYSWQDLYSGDRNNSPITSACNDPHEQVTVGVPATTTSTSLSGGGQSGPTISVRPGTGVTDAATLTGTNVATAGGTVTYSVYSNATCTTPVGSPDTVTVTKGSVPASSAVTLSTPGTYYWTASYSGDADNAPSASACGSEVETVSSAAATLKVCKVAGSGVKVGTSVGFTVGSRHITVPAGPAPGGYCVVAPGKFVEGDVVTITEQIPNTMAVTAITTAPSGRVVSRHISKGTVTETLGSGVTEVTFTDQVVTGHGYVEICSSAVAGVTGNYSFIYDGITIKVPVGFCSSALKVHAGALTIKQGFKASAPFSTCQTRPAGRLLQCYQNTRTAVVAIVPGNVSTETTAKFVNT